MVGSHSDSHKGHGDESKEMESNFCHSVSRIAKLGRNEFEECDVDEMVLAGAFASWYWAFNKPRDVPAYPLTNSFFRTIV